ncbi:hypothetical protein ABTM01_20365, partial [Acinetobacter baumannii]
GALGTAPPVPATGRARQMLFVGLTYKKSTRLQPESGRRFRASAMVLRHPDPIAPASPKMLQCGGIDHP